MPLPNENNIWTYADYVKIHNEKRYEGIDGVLVMVPSPTPRHQRIVTALSALFFDQLQRHQCEVFVAPIDVCLFAAKDTPLHDIKDWYIPDLIVVCDKNKIGDERIYGAPDLIVEILSPSTAKHDRITKFQSYEQSGVNEYWIVDPIHETVEIYALQDGQFRQVQMHYKDETICPYIFPSCFIALPKVFTPM
ncbi:Uma2 family endonuclease [Anoxybacillus tepidamans]|uniref:Uma2 family endonuclease n=1 Tax=Anoxybacteroides tepidamans TaxID=265948 RepID=A0A7W8IR93_9BACL|nr:Uma2 family endonuclease [Anoxybacillus tepidamans]MBB5325159.1 Uma2 family endonuclease [Anoxybacillus tepidamans]